MLTVTTAAETYDLTRVDRVKAELGLTTGTHDDLLRSLVTSASKRIAAFCNRVLARETVAETFRLDAVAEVLRLARYPVASVSSVVEDGTTLAVSAYELESSGGLLYRLDDDWRTTWPAAKIVVTYAAGYELLSGLPEDIEAACIALVKSAFHARARDPLVKGAEIPGVIREDYWIGAPGDSGMPLEVAALLEPYRDRIA